MRDERAKIMVKEKSDYGHNKGKMVDKVASCQKSLGV